MAFVRADPRGYLATLLPLGAHSVGLQGRNDPGIYWPLLVDDRCCTSPASRSSRTRRLHVWPIHAFVGTHLLVLMLFEADTYGYRLVMPMYAPMVVGGRAGAAGGIRLCSGARVGRAVRARTATRHALRRSLGWSLSLARCSGRRRAWSSSGRTARPRCTAWAGRRRAPRRPPTGSAPRRSTSPRSTARRAASARAACPGCATRGSSGSTRRARCRCRSRRARRCTCCPSSTDTTRRRRPGRLPRAAGRERRAWSSSGARGAAAVRRRLAAERQRLASPSRASPGSTPCACPSTVEAGQALETRLLWQPLVAHPEPQQVSLQLDDPAAATARCGATARSTCTPPASGSPTKPCSAACRWPPTRRRSRSAIA